MNDDQLRKYMAKFRTLLKDGGEVIISGPTENFLYKLGRKLAGQDFTGDYHDSEIQSIRKIVSETYEVKFEISPNLINGLYLVRLQVGAFIQFKKLVIAV